MLTLSQLQVLCMAYRWPLCMIVQIKPCGFVDPTWRSRCAYVTKARNIEFIAITVSHSYNCEFCAAAIVLQFVSGIAPLQV